MEGHPQFLALGRKYRPEQRCRDQTAGSGDRAIQAGCRPGMTHVDRTQYSRCERGDHGAYAEGNQENSWQYLR